MGIFDFIKDIGKKADNEDALEASLIQSVNQAKLGIQNFQLKFDKGLATLSGTAATQKDLELARLIVGNHRGVEKVNDDGLKLAPSPTPSASTSAGTNPPGYKVPETPIVLINKPAQMVTVKKGDTLSAIAKEYLGSANRYKEIFEANTPMLKDPDEIFPGQVLRIPPEHTATAH